jgi:hypothetical protein
MSPIVFEVKPFGPPEVLEQVTASLADTPRGSGTILRGGVA